MSTESNPRREALIAEGLTEGEADYMLSGGTKVEGLSLPEGGDSASSSGAGDAGTKGGDPASPAGQGAAADPAVAKPDQPAGEDEDKDLPPNTPVPYQRFYREKQRRQEAIREIQARDTTVAQQSREIQELRDKWARLDERLSVFREASEPDPAAAAAETKPAPPPKIEDDLFGYIGWLGEQVQGIAGKTTEVQTQVQHREAQQALETAYVSDARTFARQQPDFGVAYDWLMRNRDAELAAAGYTDPAERMRIITLDERDIVARALMARQKNPDAPGPTAVLYGLAKARGYQVAPPAQAQQQPASAAGGGNGAAGNGAANGNGAAAAVVSPSLTAQVEAIQRGQVASRSLSAGGGSPAPQGIDLSRLADMTDLEFAQWKRTLTPAQHAELRGLMGAPK